MSQYLAEPADQAMAIQGLKYLRKIMAHPDMQKWSAGEVAPGADVQSDEEILEFVKFFRESGAMLTPCS